jgi:hypothetical protein
MVPTMFRRHYKFRTTVSSASATDVQETSTIIDTCTLTLLEHVNLNVPSHEYVIDFYFGLLGFGVDPRRAQNIIAKNGTVWANCGASQFHLPYGETAQVLPGSVGLRYDSLEPLKERLASGNYNSCFESSKELPNGGVEIIDNYGNVFCCREKKPLTTHEWKQPLVGIHDTDEFGTVATKYGCTESECRGIDYVEIKCPLNTAKQIALFYDSVLDATTSVISHGHDQICMVAIGNVHENGQSSQSLLFRETTEPLPPYDGHHLAIYVGSCKEDFEQAFQNANIAGVVWVNPRFKDDVTTLQGARHWKQFRFKDIVNMETGDVIMELEHEVRSIEHDSWQGDKTRG